jgi:hypothetical protein
VAGALKNRANTNRTCKVMNTMLLWSEQPLTGWLPQSGWRSMVFRFGSLGRMPDRGAYFEGLSARCWLSGASACSRFALLVIPSNRETWLFWIQLELPSAEPVSDRVVAVPRRSESVIEEFLQPIIHVPRHPLTAIRFGLSALLSAWLLVRSHSFGETAAALFAGLAAHSFLPLSSPGSAPSVLSWARLVIPSDGQFQVVSLRPFPTHC